MVTPDYCRSMARYNRWMNERLYAICAELPDESRKQDRGAFFRSIHGTLNHLLLGDRVWMGRFQGRPFAFRSLDQELYADFDALRGERARTDAEIATWAEGLSAQSLAAPLTWTSVVNPKVRSGPLGVLAAHFFNHQTHHRGQLTTLLMQCGRDPGVTDLLWLPGLPIDGT